MTDNKALLDKADALMRRHRVFVAHGAAPPAAPGDMPAATATEDAPLPTLVALEGMPSPAPADTPTDDDIPLLTDIVPPQTLADALAPSITRQEVADAIQGWLDETLPATVLKVMDGMTDQLVAALTERARAELIEQLARPHRDTP